MVQVAWSPCDAIDLWSDLVTIMEPLFMALPGFHIKGGRNLCRTKACRFAWIPGLHVEGNEMLLALRRNQHELLTFCALCLLLMMTTIYTMLESLNIHSWQLTFSVLLYNW